MGGDGAMKTRNDLLRTGWLPVDWLHPVFELVGWLELPLANDGPDNHNTSDGSSQGNEDN